LMGIAVVYQAGGDGETPPEMRPHHAPSTIAQRGLNVPSNLDGEPAIR
jgi:hypothetical protein